MTSKEVELTGGAPWGFRMHGGFDQNQPLRISRVNPGRKASLSGIREGDVITSINGHSTKSMTNSEAHAMLRSAGPSLRLGLNEDKEMSPRRKSIGQAADLKRPSQLIADLNNGKAVLQPPVYATIRLPQHRPTAPPIRSLSSPPTSLSSTSVSQELPKIHPTNPFYTTLPSNYTSASRLPIPNGRLSLDRNSSINKSKNSTNCESNSIFSNASESNQPQQFETRSVNIPISRETTSNDKVNGASEAQENRQNPFETKRNSDPFDKYLRPEKANGTKGPNMLNSKSDTDFYSKEEITKHSVVEQKISEIEEVKTIRKIVLNGSSDSIDKSNSLQDFKNHSETSCTRNNTQKEYIITPTLEHYNDFNKKGGNLERRLSSSVIYKSPGYHGKLQG